VIQSQGKGGLTLEKAYNFSVSGERGKSSNDPLGTRSRKIGPVKDPKWFATAVVRSTLSRNSGRNPDSLGSVRKWTRLGCRPNGAFRVVLCMQPCPALIINP
jgi:hypothetical protein